MIKVKTLMEVHTRILLQNKIGLNYIDYVVILESLKINNIKNIDSNKVQNKCA